MWTDNFIYWLAVPHISDQVQYWGHVAEGPAAPSELANRRNANCFVSMAHGADTFISKQFFFPNA